MTSIESGQWVEHQPLTALDAGGPIEFLIPGSGDDYLDLSSVRLYVRARVVKGNGTDVEDASTSTYSASWSVSTNDIKLTILHCHNTVCILGAVKALFIINNLLLDLF